MSLTLLSPPGAEPVSLEAAKAWLRVSHEDDDALITDVIVSAREHVEARTGLALITQSWRERLDDWPRRRLSASGLAVSLAKAPLISVEAVRGRERDGTLSVWDPAEYRVETGEPGRLVAILPFSLPRPVVKAGGIEIEFTAGFGETPDDVPAPLRAAILHLVAARYGSDRGEGGDTPQTPEIVDRLLAPYTQVRL
ncbi:head-tail connector protein [Oceanicaulis sp.]|uniref:head-tail connector protein n=1 Tax=Oceanicaulis sp. TaxID=1924941 RepID=UPI003D2D546E